MSAGTIHVNLRVNGTWGTFCSNQEFMALNVVLQSTFTKEQQCFGEANSIYRITKSLTHLSLFLNMPFVH